MNVSQFLDMPAKAVSSKKSNARIADSTEETPRSI